MIKRKAPIEGSLKSSIQFYFGTGDSVKEDGGSGSCADAEGAQPTDTMEEVYDFLKGHT
jgi:hypothetical protein